MAETTINQFGLGVSMSCGFDLGAKTLMDSRCLVKDETELNAIPDIQRANGLLVWVQDETALYAWDAVSSSWIRNGAKGDKGDHSSMKRSVRMVPKSKWLAQKSSTLRPTVTSTSERKIVRMRQIV